MTTTSKGQSANQFAKTLGINKDTAWLFAQKIRHAMDSSQQYPLTGKVEVDEAFIGGREVGNQGRGSQAKDTVVVAIEKTRDENGIKRAYAMKIDNTSSEELKKIFEAHVSAQAQVLTDKWTGYSPLKGTYQITQEKSRGGENFELMHRFIQGLKSWLRGIYHHVDSRYLQVYLDEYSFRFNRSLWKESIFDKLVQRMVRAKPLTYKMLIINVST
jgi:transposase-like protein